MFQIPTFLPHLLTFSFNIEGQDLIIVRSQIYLGAMDSFYERLPVVPNNRASTSASKQSSYTDSATSASLSYPIFLIMCSYIRESERKLKLARIYHHMHNN